MRKAERLALAFASAQQAHRAGRLDEAERGYADILHREPRHADAMHFRGLLHFHQEDFERGEALVRRSLELSPRNAHAWNNLGNMLRVVKRDEEAMAAYLKACELMPELPDAWYNLGLLQRRNGQSAEAVESLEKALVHDSRMILAYEAAGIVYYVLGRYAEAAELYSRWLAVDPENPVAQHMAHATNSARPIPERANDGYVRRIFDKFAENFDRQLEALGYQAPALVATLAQLHESFQTGHADVLDAGCGTGLCGPLLRSSARHLVGVDLSSQMLEQARLRGCYDELVEEELCAAMRSRPGAFDLIVSADTLVYFGALEPVWEAALTALRPGGGLVFTVEAWLDASPLAGFTIDASGRYRHDRAYVTSSALAAGLEVVEVRAGVLRQERLQDVNGWVVLLRRPAGSNAERPARDGH
jgi:predicted TPR repeat methyltransferase